ncbi:MAG: class I SAM-dependent methyltransferase [Planctomycetota bacterium]
MPLLLHSLKEFDEIIFALLARVKPRSVLEIGSETGAFSDRLMRFCTESGGELITVEPKPSPHLIDLAVESETFHLYQGMSLSYLVDPGCRSEFVIIDGDHNHFTVYNELSLIEQAWRAANIAGVALLHDVGWPCGRRDSYYGPDGLPPEVVHPHSYAHGVTLDNPSLIRGGFRGEGHFAWAAHEGGPRNGVRTAVEDFLAEHPEYSVHTVDAVFGLGAVARKGSAAEQAVREVFAPYDNDLVRRLERNRLELYLKVLELQDTISPPAESQT